MSTDLAPTIAIKTIELKRFNPTNFMHCVHKALVIRDGDSGTVVQTYLAPECGRSIDTAAEKARQQLCRETDNLDATLGDWVIGGLAVPSAKRPVARKGS
ncbi:hypothetical protein [Vibrio maritimus]|uniref:hypothetical protein n=1 Tax=Vibrio maritimus TaxID=990268 RepID=UPI0037364587